MCYTSVDCAGTGYPRAPFAENFPLNIKIKEKMQA